MEEKIVNLSRKDNAGINIFAFIISKLAEDGGLTMIVTKDFITFKSTGGSSYGIEIDRKDGM